MQPEANAVQRNMSASYHQNSEEALEHRTLPDLSLRVASALLTLSFTRRPRNTSTNDSAHHSVRIASMPL